MGGPKAEIRSLWQRLSLMRLRKVNSVRWALSEAWEWPVVKGMVDPGWEPLLGPVFPGFLEQLTSCLGGGQAADRGSRAVVDPSALSFGFDKQAGHPDPTPAG